VEHSWQAEDVVAVHVADENPHLSVDSSLRLQELSLCTFSAVEE